jgi:hypothetical protein
MKTIPSTQDEEEINCEYPCDFHKGKIEWHHPISRDGRIGIYLCEAHHSVIKDRKVKYLGELCIDKPLVVMKQEIEALVISKVMKAGYKIFDIDKY